MFSVGILTALALLAAQVNAHGAPVVVSSPSGGTNKAPNVYYAPAAENKITAVRTGYRNEKPNAYLLPSNFRDANVMACEGASGAPASLNIKAGETLTVQWKGATTELARLGGTADAPLWVHAMGPIFDYIAACNGKCADANAPDLSWVKINQQGLDTSYSISDDLRAAMAAKPEEYHPTASDGTGVWALAKLIAAGSKWGIKVPEGLKPGEYIIRHELAAIHNPKTSAADSGPQHYASCIQLTVTDGGDISLPSGTNAANLYDPDGDYANFNVYTSPYGMSMPGPAVWTPGSSSPAPATTSSAAPAPATTSTPAPATTTKEAAPVTSSEAPAATTTSEAAPVTTSEAAPVTTSSSSSSAPAATETRKCKKRASKRALGGKAKMHKRRVAHGVSL